MLPAEAEQRQALARLTALAQRDLAAFWAAAEALPVDELRVALAEILPGIGLTYGDAAAALGAEWFETAREASGAPGSFAPVLAEQPDQGRWASLANWATESMLKPDPPKDVRRIVLKRVDGGLQRSIAAQHRETIMRSSIADPAAKGWKRVGSGDTCDFCAKLLGRGAVYTDTSVHFRAHDHCNCAAAPAWDPRRVDRSHVNDDFTHSTRFRSDEARVKNARLLRNY